MKISVLKITLAALTASLGACASLQSTSLSSIPSKRDRVVSAEASRTIFLGFNFDNDYVNSLENDLKKQCVGGDVRGILTKDEVINYFLYIVHKRRVRASGYCVGGSPS